MPVPYRPSAGRRVQMHLRRYAHAPVDLAEIPRPMNPPLGNRREGLMICVLKINAAPIAGQTADKGAVDTDTIPEQRLAIAISGRLQGGIAATEPGLHVDHRATANPGRALGRLLKRTLETEFGKLCQKDPRRL